MMKYVVYDLEPNDNPIFAICNSIEEAIKEQERLAQEFAEELFNADPKETGIDASDPKERKSVINQCKDTIGIQEIEQNCNTIYFTVYLNDAANSYMQFQKRATKIKDYAGDFFMFLDNEDIIVAIIPKTAIKYIISKEDEGE